MRDSEMQETAKIDKWTYHSPVRQATRAALRAKWAEEDAARTAAKNAKRDHYAKAGLTILAPGDVRKLDDGKTIEG